MKIAIGSNFKKNSFGGGNLFAINLKEYLDKKKYNVVNNLADKDIDIILITELRKYLSISSFSIIDALIYKLKHNQKVKIIIRVNENDERKNTFLLNKIFKLSFLASDHVILISKYLNEIFKIKNDFSIIHNGANKKIFHNNEISKPSSNLIKIVTHHWSANYNKGFDIYKFLDNNYNKSKDYKFQFTYIGNIPKNFIFKNSIHIKPLSGMQLNRELNNHDIYITATRNEPAGMHHIEAACCGLPILYINSGALPEYCDEYGIEFNKENLIFKIEELYKNIDTYKQKLTNYKYTSEYSNQKYLDTFFKLKSKPDKKNNFFFLLYFYMYFNFLIILHRFLSKLLKK